MGFCSSYEEVLRFGKNAVSCVAPNMLGENIDVEDMTLLFSGANVDHNILTMVKGHFTGWAC